MGGAYGRFDERPVHEVEVAAFAIDPHEVTVQAFSAFVEATAHVTTAESLGTGIVFDGEWVEAPGVDWRDGLGPAHPVTQVSWSDACAYCEWRGGRLPSEAEWEWTARNWATEMPNTALDDPWPGTAPVKPDAETPQHLLGNVWEWTASEYAPYPGADWAAEPGLKVLKGGSHRCHPDVCWGFRPEARSGMGPATVGDHIGFRCAYDSLPAPRPNILLVIIDDMRPELGCYGSSIAVTPNLDAFAEQAVLFEHAIVGAPVCGASRASMFSGLRPTEDRFTNYDSRIDEEAPEATHLQCVLAEAGYVTGSNGKILHHPYDGRACWTRPVWKPATARFMDVVMPESQTLGATTGHGPAYERAPNEAVYMDQRTLSKTLQDLQELAARPDSAPPFFLGMGIFKPHLPFTAHEMFWDLYDPQTVGLAENRFAPEGAPWQAMHNYGELRNYGNIPDKGPLSDSLQLMLRHGYLASLSFADAVFGRTMEELDRLGLAESTVVVVLGDHGWQLGEHDLWAKHALFQTSLRTPLLVRLPGQSSAKRISTVVETLDLYPTLCSWAGARPPEGTSGVDLMPLILGETKAHPPAYSRWGRGETVTTEQFSWTEFRSPETGEVEGAMLFDLVSDPDENTNVQGVPDLSSIRRQLELTLDSLRQRID